MPSHRPILTGLLLLLAYAHATIATPALPGDRRWCRGAPDIASPVPRPTTSDTEHTRYDKAGRPTEIRVIDLGRRPIHPEDVFHKRVYRLAWDAVGNLRRVDYPNGTRTVRAYDAIHRLVRIAHERVREDGPKVLASFDLERDPQGNVTKVTDERGQLFEYRYDVLDQLVRAMLPRDLVARLRAKDPARRGARRRPDDPGDGDDDEDEAAGDIAYTYDPAGNILSWNIAGRVITATYGPSNEMETRGGTVVDPTGRSVHIIRGVASEDDFSALRIGYLLLRTFRPTRETTRRLEQDTHLRVTMEVVPEIAWADILAQTFWPERALFEYALCVVGERRGYVAMNIQVYPAQKGRHDELAADSNLSSWIAVRLAHETWHADNFNLGDDEQDRDWYRGRVLPEERAAAFWRSLSRPK